MHVGDINVLTAADIAAVLRGREAEIIEEVSRAYLAHGTGNSSLPHSSFLRFPGQPANRIIALPAYVGGDEPASGLKWISSFPGNIDNGLDRASAVIIVNSLVDGRAQAIMEGSVISAKRTAASAALAARSLHFNPEPETLGLVGCGLINHEITRFCKFVFPSLRRLTLFDTAPGKAQSVLGSYKAIAPEVTVSRSIEELAESCELISFATTAGTPHVTHLSGCPAGCTILHVSLRDLAPEVILSADIVVDDPDHVCRASTSVHLAEQKTGNRDFIRCSLSQVLAGAEPPRRSTDELLIFNPFGLGILDVSLARFVLRKARQQQRGIRIAGFHPESWIALETATVEEPASQEASL
jgi:2,3-diaminopropionate biosynthesis protein SbnB